MLLLAIFNPHPLHTLAHNRQVLDPPQVLEKTKGSLVLSIFVFYLPLNLPLIDASDEKWPTK